MTKNIVRPTPSGANASGLLLPNSEAQEEATQMMKKLSPKSPEPAIGSVVQHGDDFTMNTYSRWADGYWRLTGARQRFGWKFITSYPNVRLIFDGSTNR